LIPVGLKQFTIKKLIPMHIIRTMASTKNNDKPDKNELVRG
jgi:hypothetical protein